VCIDVILANPTLLKPWRLWRQDSWSTDYPDSQAPTFVCRLELLLTVLSAFCLRFKLSHIRLMMMAQDSQAPTFMCYLIKLLPNSFAHSAVCVLHVTQTLSQADNDGARFASPNSRVHPTALAWRFCSQCCLRSCLCMRASGLRLCVSFFYINFSLLLPKPCHVNGYIHYKNTHMQMSCTW